MNAVAELVPGISLDHNPPAIAERVYGIISELTGEPDPYRTIKRVCNQNGLQLLPRMRQAVMHSENPLQMACRLAIAGNSIDFGVRSITESVTDIFEEALRLPLVIDHFSEFQAELQTAKNLLFLGDNAGEIVFDRLLIEQMQEMGSFQITYVVRERPVINDVTLVDAGEVGVAELATVISNGSGAPGTILERCSEELKSAFHAADLIISKGQGNYESLSDEAGPIFFMLKAKCVIVAEPLGLELGDTILMKNSCFT